MTVLVTVDAAGGQVGGAARYRAELLSYLGRSGRHDVRVIGGDRQIAPAWLLRREISLAGKARRVAINNVSFIGPASERWTLLANHLDFLTDAEWAGLHPSLRAGTRVRAPIVHLAARRSDVIVTPCTTMAERVIAALPGLRDRVTVRMHPISADSIPVADREPVILCPVLFAPYKRMVARLRELLTAIEDHGDDSIRVTVTANRDEVPAGLRQHPRVDLLGRLDQVRLRHEWARSRAIYFPSAIESFGYPLAEARVSGQPVIALDTAQNREIAGPALCGFTVGEAGSLAHAVARALRTRLAPDPDPFDPDSYFDWLLGAPR